MLPPLLVIVYFRLDNVPLSLAQTNFLKAEDVFTCGKQIKCWHRDIGNSCCGVENMK